MEYLVSSYNDISLHIAINASSSDAKYYSLWKEYCSQYHSDAGSSNNSLISDFNMILFRDTHSAPFLSISQYGPAKLESKQSWNHVFDILSQLDSVTIGFGLWWYYQSDLVIWLFYIWNVSQQFYGTHTLSLI
jgi:arginyl-tRNA--protein-N-Asp/Glu arginylyltransferase